MVKLFNACEEKEKKFNFTEKVEDFLVGAFYEQNLLIMIKQQAWFTKDDMATSLKKLLGIIKNDYTNLFI